MVCNGLGIAEVGAWKYLSSDIAQKLIEVYVEIPPLAPIFGIPC
jgi:hypothetical protein